MENKKNNKELTLTRVFDAPRALVWNAWTDTTLLAQWWGPRGVTNPVCEFTAQVDGAIHIVMVAGEELGELQGSNWPMTGRVIEIEKPSRIVFMSTAIIDDKPIIENIATVTFVEEDGKTKMTLHVVVTKSAPEAEGPLAGMEMGWSQSLDKLNELLAKQSK